MKAKDLQVGDVVRFSPDYSPTITGIQGSKFILNHQASRVISFGRVTRFLNEGHSVHRKGVQIWPEVKV
jgi:hypothetical protein